MGRIIIFTGKGGVGKTSVAAAHAVASAKQGKKTLLVSADMAHNLGDIFQVTVGAEETLVSKCLYALELDPAQISQEDFPNLNYGISNLLKSAGVPALSISNNFILPGFEDLFLLLKIKQIYESEEYDRIFVDCAPTGETLALLKLPELLSWYMEKFFPVGKLMVRLMSPVSKHRYHVTLPDQKAMSEIEKMHEQLIQLQELLKDNTICSVRLVCTPEKMVVEETKRNYMYLNLYRYQVDGVYINRILPKEVQNQFFKQWHQKQQAYCKELERVFTDIPITRISWYPYEVQGKDAIERMCTDALMQEDLFEVRVHTENEVYEEISGGYQMSLHLPGARKEELQVVTSEKEVVIYVNHYERCIPLPDTLRNAEVVRTEIEDEYLKIDFMIPRLRSGKEVNR